MATMIKQLVVPNSNGQAVTYEFNATQLGGKAASYYASAADLEGVSERIGTLEALSILNLIDISDAGTQTAPLTLPTSKTVAGASVALESGDTILISAGGYAKIGTGSAFRVESGDMFVWFIDGETKDWAIIQGNIDVAALRAEFATASHKHTFSGSATPNCQNATAGGTVSSTFTGTAASHNHGLTKSDKTLTHTFTGTPVQLVASFSGTSFTTTNKYMTGVTIGDHTYTPAGSVTISGAPSGTIANSGTNFVKSVSVSDHKITPAGGVTVDSEEAGITVDAHSYTPAGTISAVQPTVTISKGTDGTKSFVTSAIKSASLSGAESGGVLTLSVSTAAASTSTGLTSVGTITASASSVTPTFTGTAATLSHKVNDDGHTHGATFTGTEATVTHTVSAPTATHTHTFTGDKGTLAAGFTGTEATIKHTVTPTAENITHKPAGSVTITTGTGTANYTPSGTIGNHTISTADSVDNKSITPAGTVASTFTGTPHKHTIDQVTISGTVSAPTN